MKNIPPGSDEYLMQGLQEGELRYAGELFERYQVRLYNFFLYQTSDAEWSEDLTQTVFERMIRYRHTYKVEKPFKAWLFQIARNVKADYARKNKQLYSDYTRLDQIVDKTSGTDLKEAQIIVLQKAFARLDPEQREILLLTRFQQLKYKEVGKILGYTEGAVKVKVHRAIKQLKAHYFKIDQE